MSNLEKLRKFCKVYVGYPLSKCIFSTLAFLINLVICIFYSEWFIIHLLVLISAMIIAGFREYVISGKERYNIIYIFTYNMVVYIIFLVIGLLFVFSPIIFKKKERHKNEGPFKRLKKAIDGE